MRGFSLAFRERGIVSITHPLIHDWNASPDAQPSRPQVMLDDETLRDGLQSPSVRTPDIDQKIRILHLIDKLGIDTADIGLPGAGPHVVATSSGWPLRFATRSCR